MKKKNKNTYYKDSEITYEEYQRKFNRIFKNGVKRGLPPQEVIMKLFDFAGSVKVVYKKDHRIKNEGYYVAINNNTRK